MEASPVEPAAGSGMAAPGWVSAGAGWSLEDRGGVASAESSEGGQLSFTSVYLPVHVLLKVIFTNYSTMPI
jgi:hypothetical protein